VKCVENAQEGERNNILYWACRRAADAGTLKQDQKDAFLAAAKVAGLDEVSATKTIASASRWGAA
jgi:hypothetical protein